MQKKLPRGNTRNKSNDNDDNADEIVDVRVLVQDVDNGRCESTSEHAQ